MFVKKLSTGDIKTGTRLHIFLRRVQTLKTQMNRCVGRLVSANAQAVVAQICDKSPVSRYGPEICISSGYV